MEVNRSEKIIVNLNNLEGRIDDGKFEIHRKVPNIRHYEMMRELSIVELQDIQALIRQLLIEAERIINEGPSKTN